MTRRLDPSVPRARRTYLAVPGSSQDKIAKAMTLSADEVFLDLEDSVVESAKTDATRRNTDALRNDSWVAPTRAVRVNSVSSRWCLRDVEWIVSEAQGRLHCIVLPKVEEPSEVHFVSHLLDQLEREQPALPRVGIEILIETARGLANVRRIARASPRVEALVFGPEDYATSIGIPSRYAADIPRAYALSRIVLIARSLGLQAIDGPSFAINDATLLRAELELAHSLAVTER